MKFSILRGLARGLTLREGFARRLFLGLAALFILLGAIQNATQEQRVERRFNGQPLNLIILTDTVLPRSEVIRHIKPLFISREGRSAEFIEHNLLRHDRWTWQFTKLAKRIELDVTPGFEDRISQIRVRAGGGEVAGSLSEPEKITRDGRKFIRYQLHLPESPAPPSRFFPDHGFLNWPGDLTLLGRIAAYIGLWGGLLLLMIFISRSRRFRNWCEGGLEPLLFGPQPEPDPRPSRSWFGFGLATLVLTFAVLQWRDPYYFSQDDNLSQFLPVMLAGGQSFFRGLLFDYNPYQLLGAPTVEVGTYALTYPVTYLSYGLARLLGNENLTLEIFSMGHLLLGFVATWWAARRWGAGGALAAALGLCFILSGYALVAGRSWYYMTPLFLWFPLALGALNGIFFRKRKTVDTILLAVSLGLLFHAGNAQVWVYVSGMLAALAMLLWMREGWPARPFVHLSAAGLAAMALAMPLLVLQFGFATESSRLGPGSGFSISPFLTSIFLPLPLDVTDMNFGLSAKFIRELGPLIYSGPLLIPAGMLVAAMVLAAWLSGIFRGRAISDVGLFALAGGAAFLLTWGFNGPLWFFQASLPVMDKFTHPIKFLPLALLLLGLAVAIGWEKLRLSARVKGRAATIFALGAAGLMFWNAMRTQEVAFHYFADDPYPQVEGPLTAPREHHARIYPLAPLRSTYAGFTESKNLNFAMAHGELSLWGYDPIVWGHPRFKGTMARLVRHPVSLLQEFGVDRVLIWHEFAPLLAEWQPLDKIMNWQSDIAALLDTGGVTLPDLVAGLPLREQVAVPDAKPLAFVAGNPELSWPVTVAGPTVSVSFGKEGWPGGQLVLGFMGYDRTTVSADGRPVSYHADEFGRVVADVPDGAQIVALGYEINWMPGLALCLALLGLSGYMLWRFDGPGRRERKSS